MVVTAKKSKISSFFNKENLVKTRGDVASIILLIIVVLSFHIKYTQPIFKVFVSLHHNTTNEESAFDRKYSAGSNDILTIFSMVCLLQIVYETIKEYVIEKIVKKYHLSKTKKMETEHLIYLSIINVLGVFYGLKLIDGQYYFNYSLSNVVKDSSSILTLEDKIFVLIQISFWIQIIVESFFAVVSMNRVLFERLARSVVNIICIVFFYSLGLFNLWLVLLVFENLLIFFNYSSIICNNFDLFAPVLSLVRKCGLLATLFIRVLSIALISYVSLNGLSSPFWLRCILIATSVIYHIYSIYTYISKSGEFKKSSKVITTETSPKSISKSVDKKAKTSKIVTSEKKIKTK